MRPEGVFSRKYSLLPFWILLFTVSLGTLGCSRSLTWIHEPGDTPSCLPDRLPTWEDYRRQDGHGKEAAETGVNFFPKYNPPKIEMRFNYQDSWVKESIVDPWNPMTVNESNRMLLHEQIHYMISCLLTRRANETLRNGGDPLEMAKKLKKRATQLNLQYDKDTNHGLNTEAQLDWEREIQQQLLKLAINQGRGL